MCEVTKRSISIKSIKNEKLVKGNVFENKTFNVFIHNMVEIIILIGFPVVIGIICYMFSKNIYFSFMFGLLVAFWPLIKLKIAFFFTKKGEDPRHKFYCSFILFDKFSLPLSEIRRNAAFSASLDIIYNFFGEFGVYPSRIGPDFTKSKFKKALMVFWYYVPTAVAARERLKIIIDEYVSDILHFSELNPGKTFKALEIAGGHLQSTIIGIQLALEMGANFDYLVIAIDPGYKVDPNNPESGFAKKRALELIRKFGLDESKFVFIESFVSVKKPENFIRNLLKVNGFNRDEFHITCCIGLIDYYYTHQRAVKLLSHLDGNGKIIAANISNSYVEKWFLRFFMQWPPMKYRTFSEWKAIHREALGEKKVIEKQTYNKLFNVSFFS